MASAVINVLVPLFYPLLIRTSLVECMLNLGPPIHPYPITLNRHVKAHVMYHIWRHVEETDVAALLISKGADINIQAKYEFSTGKVQTPLHLAAQSGHTNVASLLISKGADINIQVEFGRTLLHWTAEKGHTDVASLLISKGADINIQDKFDRTPLHRAAERGRTDMAALLISKGADININTDYAETPLHQAAMKGHTDVASLLITKGADMNIQSQDGATLLHWAAEKGHTDVASLLISKGADINIQDKFDRTPLHRAAERGRTDMAALLITKGADMNIQSQDGQTSLHLAAQRGHTDMAALLISKGADINIHGNYTEPTKNESYKEIDISKETTHEYVNQDASMEIDRLGQTPLHIAAKKGQTEVVSFLISNGADINSPDNNGQTPLHLAAEKGQTTVASLLISKGADINSKDSNDKTPLHLASEEDQTDVAALLITKRADMYILDNYQMTALDIAKGKAKILLQLIENGVGVDHATQAVQHCNTLEGAQKYAQSLPPAVTVPSDDTQRIMQSPRHDAEYTPSDLPPDGGAKQPEQDIILPGIVDAVELKSLLKQGTYDSYGNRIYLAGACSVGKTTLASLLIGEEIPIVWKSTDGLEIYFGRNGIHLEERKMIPLDKHKGNENILSNVLRGQPVIDKTQPVIEKSQPKGFTIDKSLDNIDFQPQAISMSRGLASTKGEIPAVAVEQSMSYVPDKQPILKEKMKMPQEGTPMQKLQILGFLSIHEDIKNELKKGEYKVKIAPSDLVDFGGQRSYDMTHQLFIQGKGTFTLLFDGRKGLRDALSEYPQGNVTSESILKHWVDSIMTYCGEDDDDILPVILFVATHRDTLKEDEQSKMMTNFKQGLQEMFQNHERKTRIRYDDIFFINGTDGNDPEVIRLQTTYVDIAFKQKSWGKPMPMVWVPLELQMAEMRSRNISIISKDDLITVNKQNDDLALTDRQLDEFLRVQHSLGHILYIEEQGLADYVIVKPTTLVDILRSFITDEMFWPSDETLKGILKAMRETGKIKKKDLFKIWSQEEFNQHMPDNDLKVFVAQTLTYLDLLVEPKHNNIGENVSDFYLVPCMVKRQITANFNENIEKDKMISLSYLLKSTIPSALSFKLIGAALNVWPLKETDNGVCLYHQAAVLCIDKSNELHIVVREDRVIVYIINEQSKHVISPDIASCAQECLTLALKTALAFYHKSFGKVISKSKLEDLFQIEVGEKCATDTCYISLSEAQKKKSWICKFGNEHKTKIPLYWTFDKKQEKCQPDCSGIEALSSVSIKEQHLIRLARTIGFEKCKEFVLVLGLPELQWHNIDQRERDVPMINFAALCEWKKMVESRLKKPTFKMLHDGLIRTESDIHLLCKIFRENTLLLEKQHETLLQMPDEDTLKELSKKIGNCALHLGIELGLNTTDIERTIHEYSKDILDQNYDILIKWRNSGSNTTLRRLMTVLQIVDSRGLPYLADKYKIGED